MWPERSPTAEGRQRNDMCDDGVAVLAPYVEGELGVVQGDCQRIRTAILTGDAERIFFDEIVDRDGALVLLVGIAAPDRGLVEGDRDEAVLLGLARSHG